MDTLKSALQAHSYLASGIAIGAVLATSHVVVTRLIRRKGFDKELLKGPPDTVILFQVGRGPFAPSLSPFPLKLETYLRFAKIPYQNDFKRIMSSKGKTPWIAYNGEAVADSQFCIEYLNAKRGVDLNKHLTPEQKAIAKSFQIMVDEHLYWTIAYFRWVPEENTKYLAEVMKIPRFFIYKVRSTVKQMAWAQGVGRHSQDEIQGIMMADLKAISDFLGNKPFIMGDEPCETDCSMFGMLAQPVWQQKDKYLGNVIQENFPNLYRHCLRMKERFWPDWDECLGKEKK